MVTVGRAFRFLALIIYTAAFWFILPSFLYTFPITAPYVSSITTLSNWYFAQALVYSGLIFIADMLISAIDIQISSSTFTKGFTFGSILFGVGAITSIILGTLVFFNQYSFLTNSGLNILIVILLGLGLGSGFWHVRSVIFSKKTILSTING